MPEHTDQFRVLPTTGRSAETLAKRHGYKTLADLASSLPPSAAVLDVGAGASSLGREVARLRPDIRWTNLDFSYHDKRILHDMQQNAPPNLMFIPGDVTKLDTFVDSASMDAVFSYWLLPHLSLHDKQTALTAAIQLYTVVKPGGILSVGPCLHPVFLPASICGKSWHITKDSSLTAEAYGKAVLRRTHLFAVSRYLRRAFNAAAFEVFGTSRYLKGNDLHTWQMYDPGAKQYIPLYNPRTAYVGGRLVAGTALRLVFPVKSTTRRRNDA